MNTIFYTLGISLFDSLSTTLQIIVFILLLTTTKPIRNAISYLAGLSGAYFVCGLIGYLAIDQLRLLLKPFLSAQADIPNPVYYQSEFLTGVVMIGLGIGYFYWKKRRGFSGKESWILSKLRTMNSFFAFGIGVFISVTSFPVSVPYLIALGKYSTLQLDLPAATALILIYNLGYALPMILILLGYFFIRRDMAGYNESLHQKVELLNVHLTTWTMVIFGLFSVADAGCYFFLGHALMKERFF